MSRSKITIPVVVCCITTNEPDTFEGRVLLRNEKNKRESGEKVDGRLVTSSKTLDGLWKVKGEDGGRLVVIKYSAPCVERRGNVDWIRWSGVVVVVEVVCISLWGYSGVGEIFACCVVSVCVCVWSWLCVCACVDVYIGVTVSGCRHKVVRSEYTSSRTTQSNQISPSPRP